MTKLTLQNELKACADRLGFDHLSFTRPSISRRDQNEYQSWVTAGHAAGMAYMSDQPVRRLNLSDTFPSVKTIITVGVSYFQGPLPPKPGAAFGRVARYAWGADYHPLIMSRLEKLVSEVGAMLGRPLKAVVAVDTKPLLERALAREAGLGFIGKNTVLIIPKSATSFYHVGSYVFLAEILLDDELDVDINSLTVRDGCGSCTKCIDACPTNAFERPYRLNANKCIAYLTIENKGAIPEERRASVGEWIFGCDVCQDVCPFNARAFETRWPEFRADRGVGAWVSLKDILSVPTQAAFVKAWSHTPLSRAKRKGMIRNACVVAGNSEDKSLIPFLKPLVDDTEPMIQEHATWALNQLL